MIPSLIPFLHHATSAALVLLCWWLAHEESRRQPPGRLVAIGASIVGWTVLVTALGRSASLGPPSIDIMLIANKVGLILTVGAIVMRHYRRRLRKMSYRVRRLTEDPDTYR